MFTITTTKTTDGNVVSQFEFIRFSEAYTSFVERCNERNYEYEWDSESDTWTGGGRGNDNTITMTTSK